MANVLEKFSKLVHLRLQSLGFKQPSLSIVRQMVDVCYQTSLKTEESKLVRPSVTFADPLQPDAFPPLLRRADYPSFTKFTPHVRLTAEQLAKLSRAVNQWTGSLAVFGANARELKIWGVVDQMVQQNTALTREATTLFDNPGSVTLNVDGIGELSAYQGTLFLSAIRSGELIDKENRVLLSPSIERKVAPTLVPWVVAVEQHFGLAENEEAIGSHLILAWERSIARLCISLRRTGTGGAFLFTESPLTSILSVGTECKYDRLAEATILQVAGDYYLSRLYSRCHEAAQTGSIPRGLSAEREFAQVDLEDRTRELAGAVKFVASLASLDGVVVLKPTLELLSFGTKIGNAPLVKTAYKGTLTGDRKSKVKVDVSTFGTRHSSMLRYCKADPLAFGVVVSQDGFVRVIASSSGQVKIWDNVQLLGHENFHLTQVRNYKHRRQRGKERDMNFKRGYSAAPQSLSDLRRKAK